MKMKNKQRRGATVAELMVVIAVLAIAATMVVSFSAMTSGTTKLANAKLEALNEIRLAESAIEGFIESNSNDLTLLYVPISEGSEQKICRSMSTTNSSDMLRCNGGKITVNKAGNQTTVDLEYVTDIIFTHKGDSNTDTLYYCTITYKIGDSDFYYTFCVNPYAGEQIN